MRLKDLGVSIAIDDFGTGYASLSYLKRIPFDTLKLDRSFVAEVTSSNFDLTIVRGLSTLAQDLGKRVVAEGVETPPMNLSPHTEIVSLPDRSKHIRFYRK